MNMKDDEYATLGRDRIWCITYHYKITQLKMKALCISVSISIYLTFHRSTVHIRYRTCQSKIIYRITRQLFITRAYKVKYSDKYNR
jgi:hypothetical protein